MTPNNPTGAQPSKVSIVLSRALKITLEGVEHALQTGANLVDAALADHWLVKAHTLNGANVADNAASAEADATIADLTSRLAAADATIAELQGVVDAFKATAGGKK